MNTRERQLARLLKFEFRLKLGLAIAGWLWLVWTVSKWVA